MYIQILVPHPLLIKVKNLIPKMLFEKTKVFLKELKVNILTDSIPPSKFQICWCFKITPTQYFKKFLNSLMSCLWFCCCIGGGDVTIVLRWLIERPVFVFFCFLLENIFFSGTYNMSAVVIGTRVRCRTSHNITLIWYFLQLNVLYASSASFQSYLYNI